MKKYMYPLFIFVSLTIIIYILGKVHWEILAEQRELPGYSPFSPFGIAIFKMTMLGFVFGILMDWKGIKEIYKYKKLKPNVLVVPALFTLVLAIIPHYFWVVWFGLGHSGLMGFPNALSTDEVHLLISVLSGFLMVRSLTPESE